MTTFRGLALTAFAALALAPASSRAEYPPYSIQATPTGSGPEGAPVRIRPTRTGSSTIANPVCRFEIWPQAAAHGAVWVGGPDPTCAREESVPLPPGRYVLKLGVTWQAGGTDHSGTADAPYEVISTVNKLAVTKCEVTPREPRAGLPASVTWEVANRSGGTLPAFHVAVVADHATVDDFVVSSLAAGASTSRSVSWTPARAVDVALSCEADRSNAVGEAPAFRADDTLSPIVRVMPPGVPQPVIVLGTLRLNTLGWSQDYTVCNVDPDARYSIKVHGCLGCQAGWEFDGAPSRDMPAKYWTPEGTSARPPACLPGLRWKAAITAGPAAGPRNQYEDRLYELKVAASRDGGQQTATRQFHVPRHCGALSVPICVETEGAKGR